MKRKKILYTSILEVTGVKKKSKDQKRPFSFEPDAFEKYLKENEHASSTINKYLHDVHVFVEFIREQGKPDKKTVLQYKEWLWKNYSVGSCNSMISSLNRYLEFAGRPDLLVKGFKRQKQTILASDNLLTIEEYYQLLKAARQMGNERLYVCMQTIFMTGARVSELSYFTVEEVRTGRVTVRNKGKIRVILISDKLRTILTRYAKTEKIKSGPILVTRYGRPVNRSNLWKEMQQLGEFTDICPEKIHPHNLRHLFARTYYQETSDVVGLSDILGHSSLNVTRIYTSSTADTYLKGLNRMTEKAQIPE